MSTSRHTPVRVAATALLLATLACTTVPSTPRSAEAPPGAREGLELYSRVREQQVTIELERSRSGCARGLPVIEPSRPRVGAVRCGECHRAVLAAWQAGPHNRGSGADCEDCHGPGGDYATAVVMRDRVKAQEAGLATVPVGLCRVCHDEADASWLARAHPVATGPRTR
jgi:hypothetical protein